MTPRVSCIIPVYNGEAYLAESIESLLAQSHPLHEIVVVDDGSTDGTAAVVRSFGPPVRYVWQENAGPANARNHGLAQVEGDFVTFNDADDLWEPEKTARQLETFSRNPEVTHSVTLVQNFWEGGMEAEEEAFKDHARSRPIPGFVSVTLMVRGEWIERVGGFNAELGHADSADWFQRMEAAGGQCELVKEVLVRRRLHGANRSRQLAGDSRDEFLSILKARLDRARAGQ